MSKSDENSEAGMSKTYSDRVCGWLRLCSMRQVKLKIRNYAKNRNWQRATRLRLRQSLCQFQRIVPNFKFY